ncbi:MAG TPA: D-alanyl-D-alanine carboxypeptidase family protein [Pseudogracilibacillus sp.]|nr:D-alanyl-D-alanine carboxypeptidase family protein [Pseudogracilibacillus sp.]
MIYKSKQLKYILLPLIVCFIFIFNFHINQTNALETKAKTAIIVDVETGHVLYDKDAHESLPPASMTKMMTQYLVLEQISNQDLTWETVAEISDYAHWLSEKVIFSGVGLTQNKKYTVRSLYEAMAINSDNGTSVALAELIAGSEDKFVQLMNQKAKEIGLKDTRFVNATGIDNELLEGKHPKSTKFDDTNLMSAYDAAKLAYHIMTEYPEALKISSMPKTNFDGIIIRNSNWMLHHDEAYLKPYYYAGVTGLKTGHTDLAGYTLTATANKANKQLITVVMKTESEAERFKETAKLLDYGFNEIVETELFPANYQLNKHTSIPVEKGIEKSVEIATKDAISLPIEKGRENDYKLIYNLDESQLNKKNQLTAPIKKGEVVGHAEVVFNSEKKLASILDKKADSYTVDLVTTQDIGKKNWFYQMLDDIIHFFK